jgi:hypothetical protein
MITFANSAAPDNGFPVTGLRYLRAIASTEGPYRTTARRSSSLKAATRRRLRGALDNPPH